MTEDCQLAAAAAVGWIAELTGAVAAVAIVAAGEAAVAAVAVVGDGVAVASYAAAAVEAQGYEAGSKPARKVMKNEFFVLLHFSLNTSILVDAVIHLPHRASRNEHRRAAEILLPSEMDVVPIVAYEAVEPVAAADYDFVAVVAETVPKHPVVVDGKTVELQRNHKDIIVFTLKKRHEVIISNRDVLIANDYRYSFCGRKHWLKCLAL